MDALLAGDAGNRRDVDDGAAAGRLHDRDGEFHTQKYSARVDCHQPVPGRGIEQILDRAAAEAGIVDEDVEPAELDDSGVDRRPPLRFAADVEMVENRRAIHFCNLGNHRLSLIVEHIGDGDLGSFAGEDPCHAGTHAGGSSGNQCDLVLEPHPSPPNKAEPMPCARRDAPFRALLSMRYVLRCAKKIAHAEDVAKLPSRRTRRSGLGCTVALCSPVKPRWLDKGRPMARSCTDDRGTLLSAHCWPGWARAVT